MPRGITCPFCNFLHPWPLLKPDDQKMATFPCSCGAGCFVVSDRDAEIWEQIFGRQPEVTLHDDKTTLLFQRSVDVVRDPLLDTELAVHVLWKRVNKLS